MCDNITQASFVNNETLMLVNVWAVSLGLKRMETAMDLQDEVRVVTNQA